MPEPVGHVIDEYEIIALLGKGGMAEVYHARQLLAGRVRHDVALKLMITALSHKPEFVSRFAHEAEMQMSLSHPHILKAFDYGQHDDTVYLVTELMTGGSLRDQISAGPLAFELISDWLSQIGPALDYAHEQGVIHCDLKPHNVLLDANGNAFLADFGIARLVTEMANADLGSEVERAARYISGTPFYMAPEQWRGGRVDERTDLYALGVMLFEMLTGQVPFSGDNLSQVLNQHLHTLAPSVQTARPELPDAVDRVLRKALSKAPEQRYETATALVNAFKAALIPHHKVQTNNPSPVSGPAASVPTPQAKTQPVQLSGSKGNQQTFLETAIDKDLSPTAILHPPISRPNVQHVKPLARFERGTFEQMLWSPGKQFLAMVGALRIWLYRADALDSEPMMLEGHTALITSLAFSPDDKILASGADDCTVRLWNVQSGLLIGLLASHTAAVNSVSYSQDGHLLASSSDDGTIRLWDVYNAQCLATLTGHTDRVRTITFSPNGTMLVSTSLDGTMQLWAVQA